MPDGVSITSKEEWTVASEPYMPKELVAEVHTTKTNDPKHLSIDVVYNGDHIIRTSVWEDRAAETAYRATAVADAAKQAIAQMTLVGYSRNTYMS